MLRPKNVVGVRKEVWWTGGEGSEWRFGGWECDIWGEGLRAFVGF